MPYLAHLTLSHTCWSPTVWRPFFSQRELFRVPLPLWGDGDLFLLSTFKSDHFFFTSAMVFSVLTELTAETVVLPLVFPFACQVPTVAAKQDVYHFQPLSPTQLFAPHWNCVFVPLFSVWFPMLIIKWHWFKYTLTFNSVGIMGCIGFFWVCSFVHLFFVPSCLIL